MNVLVLRGRNKGKVFSVSQWCNDWFTLDSGDWEVDRKPMSPTSLAFTRDGMDEVCSHKNNGMMGAWYLVVEYPKWTKVGGELFTHTFRKRKASYG